MTVCYIKQVKFDFLEILLFPSMLISSIMPPQYSPISTFEYSCSDPSKQFEVHNPATGAVLTKVQAGDSTTAEAAIKASQEAFESWRWRPALERGALMLKCADKLEAHSEELAELLCMENGKPAQDALMFDVRFLVGVFRYFGSLVDKLPSEVYDRGSIYSPVFREPHGVCAGILPFNWPPIHTGGMSYTLRNFLFRSLIFCRQDSTVPRCRKHNDSKAWRTSH